MYRLQSSFSPQGGKPAHLSSVGFLCTFLTPIYFWRNSLLCWTSYYAHRIFICSMEILIGHVKCKKVWYLVPLESRIEPVPWALGVQSLSHGPPGKLIYRIVAPLHFFIRSLRLGDARSCQALSWFALSKLLNKEIYFSVPWKEYGWQS